VQVAAALYVINNDDPYFICLLSMVLCLCNTQIVGHCVMRALIVLRV